jgi:hypothetical protein
MIRHCKRPNQIHYCSVERCRLLERWIVRVRAVGYGDFPTLWANRFPPRPAVYRALQATYGLCPGASTALSGRLAARAGSIESVYRSVLTVAGRVSTTADSFPWLGRQDFTCVRTIPLGVRSLLNPVTFLSNCVPPVSDSVRCLVTRVTLDATAPPGVIASEHEHATLARHKNGPVGRENCV